MLLGILRDEVKLLGEKWIKLAFILLPQGFRS